VVSGVIRRRRAAAHLLRESVLSDTSHLRKALAEVDAAVTSLQWEIAAWTPPPNITDRNIVTAGVIYQQALLIYLEASKTPSLMSMATPLPPLIQGSLDRAIAALRSLDDYATCTSILAWPISVLGCVARTPETREVIRRKLECMWRFLGLRNHQYTLELVTELWEEMDREGGITAKVTEEGSSDEEVRAEGVVNTKPVKWRSDSPSDDGQTERDLHGILREFGVKISFA
jgi:hypothetical protein